MPLPATGFFEDLLGGPIEVAEVVSHEDSSQESGGARAAAHPQRYLIVKLKVKARGEDAEVGEDIHVRGKDEVAFERGAEVGVAPSGVDAEVLRDGSIDGEVEGHRETEGIEAGAEVG